MSGVDFSDPAVIASLAAALDAAGVDGIEIEQRARNVRIVVERRTSRIAPQIAASQQSHAAIRPSTVAAPMAGIFADRHPAAVAPALAVLADVALGDTLGFIRVGPMLLPVKASATGILTGVLAGVGRLVGYGDPLFEIEPRR
jgi:biotin carboxyl carrier protein